MSDINGEGIGYGGGDPDGLDYDHLIDQADAGRFVVLLPSADDDGQPAVECRTFRILADADARRLAGGDAVVRARRLLALTALAYTRSRGAEPWAGGDRG
jgi:hypothetical protein